MPFLPVNGLNLYYEVLGLQEPREPSVLFLHGLGSSSSDWALQVPAFSERYRVITLDLRAHGRSLDGTRGLTIEKMADDVDGLLAQLAPREPRAHVVGLSLGGCVALALALQRPERVRSLTLVNTFARYRPAGVRSVLRQVKRLWLLSFAPMSSVAAHVARGLFPKPEQRAYYQAAVASLSSNSRRAYFASMLALRSFDVRKQAHTINCPALVISGDRDTTVSFSAKAALHHAIPGAQLLVIPDSGHATPYDQADHFNRAVLDFISAH